MSPVGDLDVKGKIVVITGGGSGIHLELGRLVHAKGATVIIGDLRLTAEASEFVNGRDVIFEPTDVAKRRQLEALIEVSESRFGDVPDVYVAGAGAFEPSWSNFWDDTEEDDYAAVQINVNHPLKLTRIATRALLRRNKKGVVLLMASIAGYSGNFAAPLYSTTKHALIGFTKSIGELDAHEGVKVVSICPGYVYILELVQALRKLNTDRIVKTPLWTANPDAVARFGYADGIAISAHQVAHAELKLIESGEYPGGTVYEISMAGERTVPAWNITPPGYDPESPTAGISVPQEALDRANAPIWKVLAKERGL